ncbi:hypothetical protein PFISCL1PPCAC_16048, partial [Pristionchus fissidentatus]
KQQQQVLRHIVRYFSSSYLSNYLSSERYENGNKITCGICEAVFYSSEAYTMHYDHDCVVASPLSPMFDKDTICLSCSKCELDFPHIWPLLFHSLSTHGDIKALLVASNDIKEFNLGVTNEKENCNNAVMMSLLEQFLEE